MKINLEVNKKGLQQSFWSVELVPFHQFCFKAALSRVSNEIRVYFGLTLLRFFSTFSANKKGTQNQSQLFTLILALTQAILSNMKTYGITTNCVQYEVLSQLSAFLHISALSLAWCWLHNDVIAYISGEFIALSGSVLSSPK